MIKLLPLRPGTLLLVALAAEEDPDAVPDDVIMLLSETEPELECDVVARLVDSVPDDALLDATLEPALADELDSPLNVTEAEPLEKLEPSVAVPVTEDEAAYDDIELTDDEVVPKMRELRLLKSPPVDVEGPELNTLEDTSEAEELTWLGTSVESAGEEATLEVISVDGADGPEDGIPEAT